MTGADLTSSGAPDAALVAAVARGDAGAFRLLVDRHMAKVHRVAERMLSDASEADEVTQDAFLKLWTNAGRWRPASHGGGVLPWLRTIATNACLDRLRRRRFVSDEPAPERADEAEGAAQLLDRSRLANIAKGALATLPDRQRAAIVLTYYEELSNADAAQTLGLNVKAFESLLLRARQALREAVARSGVTAADLREVA